MPARLCVVLAVIGSLISAGTFAQGESAAGAPSVAGAIDVALLALPMRAVAGERAWVPIVIEIEGFEIAVGEEEPPAQAEVVLHAFDAAGEVADSATQTVVLGRASPDSPPRRGLKVVTGLALAPGSYSVRALARQPERDRAGSVEVAVEVPERTVTLLPPLIPERLDAWLLAHVPRPELADLAPRSPFVIAGQSFVPAARPAIAPKDRLPVVLMGYGLAGREAEIDAVVYGADGAEVTATRLLISPARGGPDGVDRMLGVLELPELAAGDYRLVITGLEDVPPASASFAVTAEASATSVLLSFVAPRASPPVTTDGAIVETSAVSDAALVAGYRRLLGGLERGERQELVAALAAFEASVVVDDDPSRLRSLKRGQQQVIEELAARDHETLVPLLALHHDLCLAHKTARRTLLVHHAVAMVGELAERYASSSPGAGGKILAAQALASLGGYLQPAIPQLGRQLFEQALVLHPDHASALLGLAAFSEKRGGPYGPAIQYLNQLVRAHPDDREGRLRLAINLLRPDPANLAGSSTARAIEHLEILLAGGESDWIYVLAAQELARQRAQSGDLDAAIEVLRVAGERVPEAQKLAIQLAFLYDRARQPARALATLERVGDLPSLGDPARARYNQWPLTTLSLDREALDADVVEREGLLARMAQMMAGGGPS